MSVIISFKNRVYDKVLCLKELHSNRFALLINCLLHVHSRKRYVYVFDCEKDAPGLNAPMTIDYTGAYFRRDGLGGKFVGGISPSPENEPETTNLDVNFDYFDKHLWPIIANRVPAFNAVKVLHLYCYLKVVHKYKIVPILHFRLEVVGVVFMSIIVLTKMALLVHIHFTIMFTLQVDSVDTVSY